MRLGSIPLLQGLNDKVIEFIAEHVQEVSVPIGGHIPQFQRKVDEVVIRRSTGPA